jgi:hypothetical protein
MALPAAKPLAAPVPVPKPAATGRRTPRVPREAVAPKSKAKKKDGTAAGVAAAAVAVPGASGLPPVPPSKQRSAPAAAGDMGELCKSAPGLGELLGYIQQMQQRQRVLEGRNTQLEQNNAELAGKVSKLEMRNAELAVQLGQARGRTLDRSAAVL